MNHNLRNIISKKASKVIMAQDEDVMPKIVDNGPDVDLETTPVKEDFDIDSIGPVEDEDGVDKEKVEKEVEEEIKKEKKEEATLDSISEKLEKLTDTLETVVSALENQKEVIEKSLLDESEKDDSFKEFKDDKEEMLEEDFTSEEFGIESIENKENKMMGGESLRKARKNRLYKNIVKQELKKKSTTLSEELELDKAKNKEFKPFSPVPDITKVKKSEIPEMLKLAELALELSADKSKWIVLRTADGKDKALYEIAVTDENKEKFSTPEFAKNIIKEMKKNGIRTTLLKYNASKIRSVKKEESIQTKDTKNTKEVKTSSDDYKKRFYRAFRLALSAMQKNLVDNPLKAAVYENLINLDVDEKQALKIVEVAFSKAATDHFEVALAETEKYLGMSDEAFVEMESTIDGVHTAVPEVSVNTDVSDRKAQAVALQKRAARGSLPLITASESDPTDKLELLQQVLPTPKLSGISKSVW